MIARQLHDLGFELGKRLRPLLPFLAVIGLVLLAAFLIFNWFRDDEDDEPRLTYVSTSATPGTTVTDILVLPDDGREPLVAEIDAAQESVLLEIYLLSDDEIIAALMRAEQRGVDVRILLEEQPFGGAGNEQDVFSELAASGIDVRWNNPVFRFAHIKSMVLDGRVAFVMNLNLTRTALEDNREFAVITTDPAVVGQAMAIFESDWERGAEPPNGPLVVSPTTSRQDLIDLIQSATETIDVYAEVITDREVMDELERAVERGVRVRLLLSEDSGENLWDEEPGELARAGIEVRIFNRLYVHAKAILVDDARVYLGSQNYTSTSLDDNRELGIISSDSQVVIKVARAFEGDFREGVELRDDS